MRKTIAGLLAAGLCVLAFDVSARFVSTDPVQPKPNTGENFNRYYYANNSPYKFTDPDGREIRAVNPRDQARIEKMVNSVAVGVYKFDKGGSLQQVQSAGDTSRFSQHYSDRLNQAISSDKTINVQIADTYENAFTGENIQVQGGLTQALGNGLSDQNVVVTGQSYTGDMQTSTGAPLTQTPGTILMHEMVGHAIPGAVGSETGNAVSNENNVRIQLPDADLRMRDESHIE
ncbi:hypothetical protein [Lysobacter sp. M15]|uniref:hypothetical protein n=1 Tax=Lysobacter sp. M15 TaxID=2916837 RepID=UPI001F589BC6|nr:hypothetical protein [Lysobacter sp. M15]